MLEQSEIFYDAQFKDAKMVHNVSLELNLSPSYYIYFKVAQTINRNRLGNFVAIFVVAFDERIQKMIAAASESFLEKLDFLSQPKKLMKKSQFFFKLQYFL